MNRKSILRSFSIMMGANLILVAFSFLNNKLIYVYLDREANGVYFLAMRLSLFISLLFGDWLRLSTMNLSGEDRRLNTMLSANILWYSITLGIGLTLAATLVVPRMGAELFGIPPVFVAAAAAAAAIAVFRDSNLSLLLVNHRFHSYGISLIMVGGVFLALDFVFLFVLRLGVGAVFTAWIAAAAVTALWVYAANAVKEGVSLRPSWAVFTRSREIGFRALVAVAGMYLMINIHVFVIEPFSRYTGEGLVMVAIFSVCFRLFQLLQKVADVTGVLLISHVVQQDQKTSYRMTALSARSVFFFSCTAALAALLLGKYLVLIVSDSRYLAAHIPLLVMLPGMIAVNTGSVLNTFYWGNRYPYRIILVPLFAAALAVLLDILLFPRFGVTGIALSFSITGVVWMVWLTGVFLRDSGMRLTELFIPSRAELRALPEALSGILRRSPA
jgi:O-antigen/teichoic acid export membrane protein